MNRLHWLSGGSKSCNSSVMNGGFSFDAGKYARDTGKYVGDTGIGMYLEAGCCCCCCC